jgi:hypothetical protein
MANDYHYQARQVELDRERQFRLGEGKISGYCSVLLGALSLLSVLAYLYPAYLTTTELRQAYDPAFLQGLLKYSMYFSLFFGVLTFVVILRRGWGLDLAYFCFNHLAISAIVIYANHSASRFHWAVNPDLQAVLIHCNLDLPFGFLKYIIVTPQFHHWPHSSERPAIDTNYSAHTILFDWLFKTMHLPGNHWPAKYGTTQSMPQTYLAQTLYPITSHLKNKTHK